MQAICENCGKTITSNDFKKGHYFLFWITPTIPTDSLYLCQDCRGLSWEERVALFNTWWERHEASSASKPKRKTRPAKSRKKTAPKQKKQRTSRKSASESPWEDPEYRSKELPKLAQQALALSR